MDRFGYQEKDSNLYKRVRQNCLYVALYLIICMMVVKQKKDVNSICDVVLSVSGLKPPLMRQNKEAKQ